MKVYSHKNISKINVFGLLVAVLIISIPSISILGALIFWGLLSTYYCIYLKQSDWKPNINISNWAIICFLILWMFVRAQNLYGFKNFILLSFLLFINVSKIPYKNPSKNNIKFLFGLLIVFALFVRITGEAYSNRNYLAVIACVICILTYYKFPKKHIMIACISTVIFLLFGSRSVLLALSIAIMILYSVVKLKIRLKTILLLLTIMIASGLYIVWDIIMSPEFNEFIFENTNKNFQSGRNLIWAAVFEYMKGIDWIIGVGGGIDHSIIVPERFELMSLHSTYIFMLFHYGIIGLGLLVILFYRLLNDLITKGYLYSALIFLFFILRDFFEITLINNHMAMAVLFWGWIANGWLERTNNIHSHENITVST